MKAISLLKISTIGLILSILTGCAAMVAGTAATGVMVAQDRRTTGTIVEDKSIELKAFQAVQKILQDEKKAHISVVSYNNRVVLLGQSPNDELKKEVEDAVRSVAKVKKIHNEINLAAPTSLLTRSSDTWITTKIKSEMLVNRSINPTRIKVVTEDGVVYLMGIITPEEEHVAVDIARHVKGVKKVVKIFEYQNT